MAAVSNPTGQHICEAVMMGIEAIVGRNDPQMAVTPVGMIQALYDPSNRQNTRIKEVDTESGQIREVRILRKQRGTPSEIGSAKTCAPVTEKTLLEEKMTVTQYRQAPITVTEERIKRLCAASAELKKLPVQDRGNSSNNNFLLMQEIIEDMMLQLDALRQTVNGVVQASVIPQLGIWQGGAASISMPVVNTSTGEAILKGFNTLGHNFRQSGMNGKPIVVGYGKFDEAVRALSYGCCNDGGTDFGQMNGARPFQYYEDFQVDAALGADNVFVLAPGSVQLVTYNEYRGSRGGRIDNVNRGTMPDLQIPGLKWDLRVIEDGCNERYTMIAGLWFDTYVAPLDSYAAGDRLAGVNGAFKAVATQQYAQQQIVV